MPRWFGGETLLEELARINSIEYKREVAERNKFLNEAWDELIELCPGSAHFHPHLSERINPGIIQLY